MKEKRASLAREREREAGRRADQPLRHVADDAEVAVEPAEDRRAQPAVVARGSGGVGRRGAAAAAAAALEARLDEQQRPVVPLSGGSERISLLGGSLYREDLFTERISLLRGSLY